MFYTYLWLREDGTPYYVGKCTRLYRALHSRDHNVFCPKDPDRIIIQEHVLEKDALEVECFFISFYGRKDTGTGCLRNFTDGGEGMSGNIPSPETRAKLSAAKQGMQLRLGSHHSEDTRKQISASLSGSHQPASVVAKRTKTMEPIRNTHAYREKMQNAANKRWHGGTACSD
jgi:hypothetical protein